MAGRGLPPERVRAMLGYLGSGLNPMQAARAAGVSKSFVCRLDQAVSGVSWLAVKRQAAARRAAQRAASPGRTVPPERVRALLDQLAAGLNPMRAVAVAVVSKSFACRLQHSMGGVYRPPGTKGTDLSAWTPAQLAAIADQLNDRPRKRPGYHTPREEFARLLAEDQRVATTP